MAGAKLLGDMYMFFRRLFSPHPKFIASKLQTKGASGPDIEAFQCIFNKRARRYGIVLIPTGIYDDQTIRAVQMYARLALNVSDADGFVGPQLASRLRISLGEEE